MNLCLQDAGGQIPLLRNALDIVREIEKLIKFSPMRSQLFHQKLSESEVVTVNILCATRWTARTSAIEAVVKDSSIIETMAEIHSTTHDEYGLRAGGILSALEKFSTLFGLKLTYTRFSTAEVSKSCQLKISQFKKQYHLLIWYHLFTGDRR